MCQNEGDDDEASASEEEEEEAPKKKAKTEKGGKAASSSNDNPNKGKMQCTTRSGEEAPKNVKKMQETMKMSVKKFLESDKSLEIDVDGNKLSGQARTFSSGACGWYLGGKVEIDVGGQSVWAQVGSPPPRRRHTSRDRAASRAASGTRCVSGELCVALLAGRHERRHSRLERVEKIDFRPVPSPRTPRCQRCVCRACVLHCQ